MIKGHRDRREDDGAEVGPDHAVGVQRDALVGLAGHDRRQRPVRQVDQSVDKSEEEVRADCPDDLPAPARQGRGEGEHADDGEERRAEENEGTEPSPAGPRALGDPADHRVEGGVEDARHGEHHARDACGQADVVRVEEGEEGAAEAPHELAGEVAAPVCELGDEGEPVSRHLALRSRRRRRAVVNGGHYTSLCHARGGTGIWAHARTGLGAGRT